MQKILIIVHAPPYGSERCLSALRLATALAGRDADRPEIRLFLMSDATVLGLPHLRTGTRSGRLAADSRPQYRYPARTCRVDSGRRQGYYLLTVPMSCS